MLLNSKKNYDKSIKNIQSNINKEINFLKKAKKKQLEIAKNNLSILEKNNLLNNKFISFDENPFAGHIPINDIEILCGDLSLMKISKLYFYSSYPRDVDVCVEICGKIGNINVFYADRMLLLSNVRATIHKELDNTHFSIISNKKIVNITEIFKTKFNYKIKQSEYLDLINVINECCNKFECLDPIIEKKLKLSIFE